MTSASELFHARRSRFGRSSSSLLDLGDGGGEEPPLDSSSSSSHLHRIPHPNSRRHRYHVNHHHGTTPTTSLNSRRHHHNRLDIEGCDPLPRRPPHPRHHLSHRHLLPDHESGWLDQGSSPSALREVNNSESVDVLRGGLRSAGNDRLPGTVLLARERLLQRLRGVSLSANRQRHRPSSSIHHNDFAVEDDFRLADVGDWDNGISREWLAESVSFTDILSTEKSERPPGLTQEALDSLKVEIFSKSDNSDGEVTARRLEDCSICLESFLEGDKLIFLTCGHRFHFCCLDPWVRICGDCPNCRKAVVITGRRAKERV
ncbi:probable E3 ubiquitin-protein ligase RHY1A [Coffea eugenioides]|uniref:probable E3 ubiquitin-protein ligase RHY1A n=1 Tax=Coffea eugenioides TaxID=49369 RepID=UPI000F607EF9|nr:probable E3 ubiquitin-protein ligase RHY1A [Coffea eugenioides]